VRAVYESLADPTLRLHQAYTRFYTVMRSCGVTRDDLGVTAHGLRHGFAHRRYSDVTGSPVPTFGGGEVGKEMDRMGRMQASLELGHARPRITQAYLGGLMQQGLLPLGRPQAQQAAPSGK
jgi:integrase